MHDLGVVQRSYPGDEDLCPGDVARPDRGIRSRSCLCLSMSLTLFIEHLLEVCAIFDELVGLEVTWPTPPLFEGIVPDYGRGRRLILLEKDLDTARRLCRIRYCHHTGAEHLGDSIAPNGVADLQLLG